MLSPLPEEPSLSVMAARSHLNDILKKEHKILFRKYFTRRYQSAWAALCLVLILTVAFVFPPIRALASSFLGLFRVQRIAVVEFNPASARRDQHAAHSTGFRAPDVQACDSR